MKLKQFLFTLAVMLSGFAISVNAQEAKIGTTTYGTLAEAVKAAAAGDEIVLLKNVTLTGGYANDPTAGLRIEKALTINGNKKTIDCGTFKDGIRVYINSNSKADVEFNNVTIKNDNPYGRCIDMRTGKIALEVKGGAKLIAHGINSQPLTVGGSAATYRVRVSNATIDAGETGYGIISFVRVTNNIEFSSSVKISGLAALYLKEGANNTTVTMGNGTYTGTNLNSAASGMFGAVVIEGKNNTITVNHEKAVIKAVAGNDANQAVQAAFLLKEGATGNKIQVTNANAQVLTEGAQAQWATVATDATNNVLINKGQTVNFAVEYNGYQFMDANEVFSKFVPQEKEATIKLLSDVTLDETWTVAAGQNITLDLNGKTASMAYTKDATANHAMISNKGNLTIVDSSNGGKLSYTYAGANLGTTYAANTITSEPGSVLTVKNGIIENLTYDHATIAYAIDGRTNGGAGDVTVNIEGGVITSKRQAIRIFANSTTKTGTLNISNGDFTGRVIVQNASANANKAVLNITGGTFNANEYKSDVLYLGGSNSATIDINASVNGGTFNGEITQTNVKGFISGGTFSQPVAEAFCAKGYAPIELGNGTYGVQEGQIVALIGSAKYFSLADALAAAKDGETISLQWRDDYTPIAMNGSLYGNKSVTITGTATVDWNKGFLFVARGGEGNATLTFENANLTSASNSSSYGIHVSGREKDTNNKYDGTLIIKNSAIELDYLINKGAMTLDNSSLTVKNGFDLNGRPASETENGEDANATLALTNGSKLVVNNHNGMGIGREGKGELTVDASSTFEHTLDFLVCANGTMDVKGTLVSNGKKLTNNGEVKFTATKLTDATIEGTGTTRFYNDVNFYGANSITTTGINGTPFHLVVNEGANLFITRFVLGYDRNITVNGTIADASTFNPAGQTPSLKFNSTSGVSVGGTGTGNITAKNAYVEFGNSSWKSAQGTYDWNFENCYVSATSFTNAAGPGADAAKWDVTFDNSVLAAKNYIKNGKNTTYNFINSSKGTTGSLRIDGELNIDATSSVVTTSQQNNVVGVADEHGGINGTVNVAGSLTIGSNAKTQLEVLGGTVNVKEGATLALGNNTMTLDAASAMQSAGNISGAITAADGANVAITGGTYTQDVSEWCDDAFMAKQNAAGTFDVVAKPVAKVGNTEYTTIDEAIAAWTNNTTLTLLADVTLSDVIKLKSTEHHTLNLGTYTMTAASGKNAIEITCEGLSNATYAITVNADANNPGGITATGKACIYYSKSGSTKDRPIIRIYNGVFNGSYSINSKSNGNTNCPQIWIYGGTFNGNVNLTKNMLRVFGGTFNGWINCTGDSSAYREISGGTFKSWQFMTADADNKFWVGTSKANYNVGVHVDDNGYLVVGGDVVTEPGNFEASSTNYDGWSSYLKYSSAKNNGLYYTSVEEALADNKKATGVVTVYADEIDMTDIDDFKGTIIVPAGESVTITNAPADLKVATTEGNVIVNNKGTYVSVSTSSDVATKAELQAALANELIKTIVLTADIDYGTDQLKIEKEITLDLGGNTLTTGNAYGGMSIKNNPTVKNGTIVHKSNTAAIKVWNAIAFEDLVIDVQGKGDANKTIGGIVLQSGSTTKVGSIKNVTIKGAALTNGIETYNCGDATENVIGSMENVTIDANGTGLLISAPCGTATNCTISGDVNGIEISIKGNYSASLNLVNSKVEGGVYAHDEFSSNPDIVNNGKLNFTADEATTGAEAEDVTLTIARAEAEKVTGVLKEVMDNAVAKLNNTYYLTLQAAVDAVKDAETITLVDNVTGDITLTEKVGLHYTIDGAGKTMQGSIKVEALSDTEDNRRITIQNISFKDETAAEVDFISSVNTNHYPRLTIKNCTFVGSGDATDVAVRLKSSHSVVITNCTGTGLHSFLQNTSGWNLTIDNVKVTESKGAFALGTVQGVTIKGSTIDVATYGIRMDAQYNNNAVIESNTVKAFIPVVVRKAEVNSNVTVKGTNTMNATNTDGIWCAVGTSEYEANGTMPTAATGKVKVSLNGNLDADGVYGNFVPVAAIGEVEYDNLQKAIDDATEDANTIKLVADLVIDSETYTIADDKNVTLDLDGKKITVTDNKSGNYELFYIYGGMTVTGEGSIELKATNDRDWNASSSIFHNRGGVLTIANGTFKHLGGTDMAYVVDNSGNWYGDATTNINGGELSSTYIAIRNRMEQNSHGASGKAILNVTAGTISGTSRAIWAQAASTSETAPATGEINISGGTINGLIDTPRSTGAQSMTTISGGTVAAFKGESGELKVTGEGQITGDITIMTAAGEQLEYMVVNGLYVGKTSAEASGTWGGIDWTLTYEGTLIIAPTAGTPGTDNSGKWSYEVGQWPEAVKYNNKGEGVSVEGWPYDRSKVKTLIIKEGVTSIGSFTAQNFTNLTGEVVIPYTVKYIGQEAFQRSTFNKITFAPVPEGKTGEELCIAQGALKNLVIEEITFPEDRPVHLHAWMFANSNNLKHVTLPATIKSINGTTHVDYNHNPNQTTGGGANTSDILGKCPAVETITFGSKEVRDLYYNPGWTRTDAPIVVNVGLKSYKDFRAGIDAAKDGETVLLLGNVTLDDTWTIPAGMNLTLNLNGKTISQTKECTASYAMINNKGNLTITGNGKISFKDTGAGDPNFGWGSYTVRNEGNLVVEKATIEHLGTQTFGTHCIMAIYQYSGSTTINGGKISTPNYRSARLWKGEMTINGGTFDGQVWVQAVDESAKLTINGGTFAPSANGDASSVFVTNNQYDVQLAVTNGTFDGKVGCSDADKLAGAITGGKFTETAKNGTNAALIATDYAYDPQVDEKGYYVLSNDFVAAVNGLGYETFAAAYNVAQAGETITLLADIEATEVILLGKSLTINGNGHKVTSNATRVFRATTSNTEITLNDVNMVNTAVRVGTNDIRGISVDDVQNVKLTLNNCSVDFTDASADDWTYAVNVVGGSGHVVTVNGGAYEGANVINVRGANQTVTVKDATLTSLYPNNGLYFGACIYVVQNENSSVVATGNTFNGDNAKAFNVGYTPIEESDNIDNTKYVVAMIGDAYYTSIQAAVEAAKDGETIKLTQNVKMDTKTLATQNDGYATIVNVAGKAVTLDLNGKNITVDAAAADLAGAKGKMLLTVFHADTNGELTLTDNTADKAGAVVVNVNDATVYSVFASESQYSDKSESGKLTVNAGNYTTVGKIANAMFFADANEVITVNGGNFHCDQVSNTANYPWMFNTYGNNELHVTVNGGTFNVDINHQLRPFEVKVPETLAVKANDNGTWTVVPAEAYITEMLGATVNEAGEWGHKVGYATIAEAIAAVNELGNKVSIAKDLELTEAVVVPADKTVVLDLNGKTVTMNDASGAAAALLKNNGNLTIMDGTEAKAGKLSFKTTTPSAANAYASNTISNYGVITIESGNVENLSVGGGACYALDNYAGSTATINGGKLTAEKTAVRIFNWTNGEEAKATINMNGGEIYSKNGYGINVNSGNAPFVALNIAGGTITTDYADYKLAVYVVNKGTAENFTANVTGGTFNGIFALNGVTAKTMKQGAVAVSGGTFEGVTCYEDPAYGFVSGGTFKSDVDAKAVATGFICKDNGDGTFGVIVDPKHGMVAQIIRNDYYAENQYFATINDAVQAAVTGETVTLIADVETSAAGYTTITDDYAVIVAVKEKEITLDLNGKSVTVTPTAEELANAKSKMLMSVFGMDTNGKLTLTGNGSVKVNANGANVYSLIAAYGDGSAVVIENGNYEADAVNGSGSLIYSHEMITVMGGTFNLGNLASGANGSPWIFNTIGQNYTGVKVVGGTYPTDINHQFWANEVLVPEAYALKNNGDGTWTVVDAVAYTNEKATSRGASWRHVGYASLEDAIAATGKYNCQDNIVTMIKDITLEPITIANGVKVAIDLNGKTISGTDNSTATYCLITNKGDLTINGTGAITLTANNDRGWGARSAVISNEVGGKLTVNGGTIQHLGGTSMAYAIDNLTNGKGTYAETIINGGEIKSTYRPIRMFLNGVEAQNILTVKAGTIESTGGNKAAIWMQDPSKNANTGTLYVGADAVIKNNVYLDVTAGSTEWPVEAYIAKAALAEGMTVIAENVPADAAALVEYDTFWQVEQKNLAELTIEDACEEYINKIEKNVAELTYERYFDDTEWQTIILPFNVPVANLMEQFEVAYIYNASYKGKQATIDYVIIEDAKFVLAANYPYMIRAKETGWNNIVVENAKLMPTTKVETLDCSSIFEKFSFIGNYATVDASDLDGTKGYFNLTSGAWSKMETVNPFRFYMQIELRNGNGAAFEYPTNNEQIRMRRVDENGNADTTGIDGVDAENAGDFIFDLHGRRVLEPLKGGLYIINGKKVLF